ncbi:MAG: hypothetical protein K5660_01745 [Paludibacteraceae bacterium]|nr:hypothetical protein [Paludibacteraceae bacterium]
MTKVPTILTDISEHLASHNFRISAQNQDGRINSAINEDEVLNYLERTFPFGNYELVRPQARDWFDFAIEDNREFYPINIKVTNTTSVDNLNCKLGIYYALTGLKPAFGNEISWLPFFQKLNDSFGKHKDKDYYFLIVNKRDLSDVFCSTLKSISNLTPNGNNLPFQSKWQDNHILISRTFEEAADFIMTTFAASIKLRSDIYFNFKKYFPQYV